VISRVAEHCFWLHRYIERAENTARLLQVNFAFVMDARVPEHEQWWPVLRALGEEQQFSDTGSPTRVTAQGVQDFVIWDSGNPDALVNSVRQARANAHAIRETISLEMWEAVNTLWLWLSGDEARRLYDDDRYAFYEAMKHGCQRFHGLLYTTVSYDQPFDFMRLGALMERADQTIRMLDAAFLRAGTGAAGSDTPLWLATLRSCSAMESYFKRAQVPVSGRRVGEFLLFDLAFPRAVAHCLQRSGHFLRRIGAGRGRSGRQAGGTADELLARLRATPPGHILDDDKHAELDRLLTAIGAVADAIVCEYFPAAPVTALEALSVDA
jgi:uncharacterized alpha-E superfamily protein